MNKKNKQLISFFLILLLILSLNPILVNSQATNSNCQSYNLLILSPDKYINPLNKLKNHKESVGIKTKIASLSQVYDQMFWKGRDNPEKIKYFIKQAYDIWNISYVLLIGDFRDFPIRYVNNQDILQGFYEPKFISELYYADIIDKNGNFSSWDTDNDGIFGEWINDDIAEKAEDSNIDLYPDVYVGRLAVRNTNQLNIMINKIITYENNTFGKDWFNNIVVCAGDTYPESENPDWEGNEGEENTLHVLENMTNFNHIKLWTSDDSFQGVNDIINAFTEGCGFVYFDGHANPFRWSTHPPNDADTWIRGLSTMTMNLLHNKEKLPIVVVGGCHNLQFDVHPKRIFDEPWYLYTWIPECWGWKLTHINDGGSIATIGCSGLGMTKEDKFEGEGGAGDYLEPSFFYEYGLNGTDMLGEVWGKAITRYLTKYPINWNTPAAWNDAIDAKTVQQWVLLGDPSLKIDGYPKL
jgi:hypothetical protein